MIPLFLFVLLFSTLSIALGETVVLPEDPEDGIDTYISNLNVSSSNIGDADFMWAWSNGTMNSQWIWAFSLVKFVLPPSLDTENIVGARLELYAYAVSQSSVTVNVHRVEREWDENSAWSDFSLESYPTTQDLFNENVEDHWSATPWGWMSFDVTDLVKDWISDPLSNYGVLLETPYSEVPSGESRAVFMCTSDAKEPPCVGYYPKLIIDYRETIPATIDFHPERLNLKSNGKWVTCYIELPEGHDVKDIDINTTAITSIALHGREANFGDCDGNGIPAEPYPTELGDYDGDGIPDLMIKFDRGRVQERIADLMVGFDRQSVQNATSVTGLAKVKVKIYFEIDSSGFEEFDTSSTGSKKFEMDSTAFEGFAELDILDKDK